MTTGKILNVASIEDNKLKFNHLAFSSILDKVGTKKFSVVSLNGRTGRGKSFMLTQFLKFLSCKSNGNLDEWIFQQSPGIFTWASSADRTTLGIQMWDEPIVMRLGNGEEVAVLVMDTQGLFDHHTTHQQNALLFTLSSLLSSNFIFNDCVSSEDVFEFLHVFLEYSKVTCGNDGSRLLFLRRDWQNENVYSFGYHSSTETPAGSSGNLKEYLFDVNPGQSKEAIATRRRISALTNRIGVYALPQPEIVPNPDILISDWDTGFRSEVVKFVEWVFSDVQIVSNTMKIRGEDVSGENMKAFVLEWSLLLQDCDNLPVLQSLETATTNSIATMLIKTCVDYFSSEMNSVLIQQVDGYPSAQFDTLSNQKEAATLAKFDSSTSLGVGKGKFRPQPSLQITTVREAFKQNNAVKLQLAQEKRDAADRAEDERKKREKAEHDARLAAAAAEAARIRQVEAQAQHQRQRQARIAAAEAEVNRANNAVHAAQGNLSQVQNNSAAHNYTVSIATKHPGTKIPFTRTNITSGTVTYHNETRFNAESYQQAVNIAQQAVNAANNTLATANANLQAAKNS